MREGRIGSDRERIATLEGEVREGKWRREGEEVWLKGDQTASRYLYKSIKTHILVWTSLQNLLTTYFAIHIEREGRIGRGGGGVLEEHCILLIMYSMYGYLKFYLAYGLCGGVVCMCVFVCGGRMGRGRELGREGRRRECMDIYVRSC